MCLSQTLQGRLDALAENEGLLAVLVAGRDGIAVLERTRSGASKDTIAAMAAAILGGADALLEEDAERVDIEGRGVRSTIVGIDEDLLLVLIVQDSVGPELFSEWIAEASDAIHAGG